MKRGNKKRKLIQEAEKLMNCHKKKTGEERCEVCGGNWRLIIHHFISRRQAKFLTYEPLNWIILCANCHFGHEIKKDPRIAATIIEKKGKKWYNNLMKLYEKGKGMRSYYGIFWLEQQIKKIKDLE